MKFVEIYRTQDDGSQKVVAECKQTETEVEIEGDPMLAMQLMYDGIIDYSSSERKKLYPRDGEKFLDQLKNYFKSGYVNASDVKEK
jgi:hypothetical protein